MPRLNEIHSKASKIKIILGKDLTTAKAKNQDDYSVRIEQHRKDLEDVDKTWLEIWNEESFLVLNYRMEISAREV